MEVIGAPQDSQNGSYRGVLRLSERQFQGCPKALMMAVTGASYRLSRWQLYGRPKTLAIAAIGAPHGSHNGSYRGAPRLSEWSL